MIVTAPACTSVPSPAGSAMPGRPVVGAIRRGLRQRSLSCDDRRPFRGYVKQEPQSDLCSEHLLRYRADDAPAYFTILLVGHAIVLGMLALDVALHPPTLIHTLLWVPLALALTVLLLRPSRAD
jgi:uncharacterized protein (DUF983 family)